CSSCSVRPCYDFWAARLPVGEELDCDAPPVQRRGVSSFRSTERADTAGPTRPSAPAELAQGDALILILEKYDAELQLVLCSAVSEQTLLKTVTRIFSEAEAENQDQRPLPQPDLSVYDEIMQPVLHSGFLYKSVHRGTLSRRTREDFQRFWCSVGDSVLLYESDRAPEACLQISPPDASNNNGFIDRFRFTFEMCLSSEKLLQFGLETADALHSWTRSIGKALSPLSVHCLLSREFERVGVLRYRNMLDAQQWRDAFFVLQKTNLFICPRRDGAAEDIINLKRIASETENQEKKDILVLVERGRTLHLQGVGRSDFSLWFSDIQRAAGGEGNALREQQLSRNDIPIIVDSCLAFITQYGEQRATHAWGGPHTEPPHSGRRPSWSLVSQRMV
ncbi:hypothetical protein KUCAC02_034618, partial [Chaenocephalus aceratus]